MDAARLARAFEFMESCARRQAGRVVAAPGGFAVLNDALAASYLNNKLILSPRGEPPGAGPGGGEQGALAAADRILGGAGLNHRLVEAHREVDPLAFLRAGYQHAVNLVMCHGGGAGDRPADPAVRVEPIDVETMRETSRREWRERYPRATETSIGQLARRRVTLLRAAPQVVFLGVRERGAVVSHADLYADPAARVAQIEDVKTDPRYTGRGLARAVLTDGLCRARELGCDLVFLVADANDWPRRLYARLGYEVVGRMHEFVRQVPAAR
jgi:ribosomal protein S18 acetylase RimI-like enzyme